MLLSYHLKSAPLPRVRTPPQTRPRCQWTWGCPPPTGQISGDRGSRSAPFNLSAAEMQPPERGTWADGSQLGLGSQEETKLDLEVPETAIRAETKPHYSQRAQQVCGGILESQLYLPLMHYKVCLKLGLPIIRSSGIRVKPDSNRIVWLLRGSEFPDSSSHLPLVSVLMWPRRGPRAENLA